MKERFLAYKLGIAFCDFNHDRTTSFEGFDGMVNFAREVRHHHQQPGLELPVIRSSPLRAAIRTSAEKEEDVSELCHS